MYPSFATGLRAVLEDKDRELEELVLKECHFHDQGFQFFVQQLSDLAASTQPLQPGSFLGVNQIH